MLSWPATATRSACRHLVSKPPGAAHVADPTCPSAPTLPRNKSPSDANCPTPHDLNPIQRLANVCRHFSHNHVRTTKLPPYRRFLTAQSAELPLPPIPTSHSNVSRLSFPDSRLRSPVPSLAHSSIAAPTTARDFLQASLSKMPRSNPRHPQHLARGISDQGNDFLGNSHEAGLKLVVMSRDGTPFSAGLRIRKALGVSIVLQI